MARLRYTDRRFSAGSLEIIRDADTICAEYAAQGLSLTLRQLYYQFVARGLLPNRQTEYKRLGSIMNDARMAGLLDWDYLVDRTRNLVRQPSWNSPAELVRIAAAQYRTDLWRAQRQRVEVWIEKDAGIGVIEAVCNTNAVAYFSCRGYTSVSEIWAASQRIGRYLRNGEQVTILHVGDHDPSGIDMSRDIEDRLRHFILSDWLGDHELGDTAKVSEILGDMRDAMELESSQPWEIRRIALNYDQVEQYQPPPNPAKTTDSRFQQYMADTGLDESWELDALDPAVLQALIQDHIDALRDESVWENSNDEMEQERTVLTNVSRNWSEIAERYAS